MAFIPLIWGNANKAFIPLIWRAVPLCSTNFPVCANTHSAGCVKFLAKGSLLLRHIIGRGPLTPLLSASRKAQNTRSTLKEEIFSASLRVIRVIRDSDKSPHHPRFRQKLPISQTHYIYIGYVLFHSLD